MVASLVPAGPGADLVVGVEDGDDGAPADDRAGRAAEALPCLLRATRLAPNVAQHHHDAGLALETLGRDLEAGGADRILLAGRVGRFGGGRFIRPARRDQA